MIAPSRRDAVTVQQLWRIPFEAGTGRGRMTKILYPIKRHLRKAGDMVKNKIDRQIVLALVCIVIYALCLIFLGESDAQLPL
ncbi:MAG: hypothetical protein J5819_05720 [Eubacterium sp.]|nr:hypothetical protein [Eubacterium sp.]